MLVIGIDPGLTGAIAQLHEWGDAEVDDMPTIAYSKTGFVKRAIDPATLATLLWAAAEGHRLGARPATVFMERVSAFPGQGVGSMFSLGMSYWGAAGVVQTLGLPLNLIEPREWKGHFKLNADKELSRGLASRLYPAVDLSKKKHHGRAESLLIARYGQTKGGARGQG